MPRPLTTIAAIVVLVLAVERRAGATNLDVHIAEFMAGANGDSRIQFIVLAQEASGQNLWGPQPGETQSRAMLVFFDVAGRETGKFKFTSNPPTTGATGGNVLVATQQFASLAGAPPPDVIIPPLLTPISGKVCFKHNPANSNASPRNECVSYGSFSGDTENNFRGSFSSGVAAGAPAAALRTTDRSSLFRGAVTDRNADFSFSGNPGPVNNAGATFQIQLISDAAQGEALFKNETFLGNGRTCASCHVDGASLRLPPGEIQSKFIAVSTTFDPLFISEAAPSGFDAGFDFNLNTLTLTTEVATGAPCTGELRGLVTSGSSGGRAKVLAKTSLTTYVVYGGRSPALSGTVTDGVCSGTVSSVTAGDLAALEDPHRMRVSASPEFPQGRGLILENIEGFSSPAVFRKPPALLNLNKTGPYGFNGNFIDLQTFAASAVTQHLPRTLARSTGGASPDFRTPTFQELSAIEEFLLRREFPPGSDPDKFDLARFATTAAQRRGRALFFGSTAKCSMCHGGTVLAITTASIQGKPIGINVSFNTGVVNQAINSAGVDNLPCEPPAGGACGSREFSVPQLFNVRNIAPFFHDASALTVRETVDFYTTSAFNNSPAGIAIGGIHLTTPEREDLTSFLNALVVRPYASSATAVGFGNRDINAGPTAVQNITITNTSASPLTFSTPACALTGANPGEFVITTCSAAPLAAGQSRTLQVAFDPASVGGKSAILELNADDSSGIDLSGTGVCGSCFTDGALVAGASPIRAVHLTELRARIDALRQRFALAPFAWADANLGVGSIIRAQHIADLRSSLAEVYAAAGMTPPGYTDPDIRAGVVAKAAHVNEIRAAIVAIE